jgi:uncharacterized protein (TIGR03435 family)
MGTFAGRNAGPLAILILLQTARAAAAAEPAASFEAASIKPTVAQPGSSSGVTTRKGSLSAGNVTLKRCIRAAYDVQESQIAGPDWIGEDRYDIEAKAAGPAGDRELMAMLQTLLSDRFKLAFHRETKDLPGYALVLAKSGLKAKPSQPDAESNSSSSRIAIDAQACNMRQLAQKLSEAIHLPVADQTGVQGAFDFKLRWTPEDQTATAVDGPSIFAALTEQLGLKLEPRKLPVQVLVVDHAEKASEN